jgi:hypothetical protein
VPADADTVIGAVGLMSCAPEAGVNCNAAAGGAAGEEGALDEISELGVDELVVPDGADPASSALRVHAVARSATMATTAPAVRMRFRTSTPLPGDARLAHPRHCR